MAERNRWFAIAEFGFVSGMRLLFWAYRHSGPFLFGLVLKPVVFYYFLTNRLARNASLEFLQRAHRFGARGMIAQPGWRDVYRHMSAFAESAVDKLGVWTDSDMLDRVVFPHRFVLVDELERGQGVVILGAHLGNLEICRGLSRRNPLLKLNILVHTRHADKFNKLLAEMEAHRELELIEVSELSPATALRLTEAVKRGEFIAVLADRIPVASRHRKRRLEFLGEYAEFPEGPFILANLLKCPVYTLFCTRTDSGYEVRCDLLSRQIVLPRGNREAALEHYMNRYVKTLQQQVLDAPYQWFNFYPFWSHDGP